MTDIHPLDHDGDGVKGGSLPKAKRGRPAKVKPDAEQAETETHAETEAKAPQGKGRLKVLKADTIHDGEGGFLPVGAAFDAVDDDAAESLKAKGHAE
jgi:hypothetical protein